jgi:hypothetical protein
MRKITFLRNLIVLVALLVGSGSVMGQGTEDFESQTALTAVYLDGSFTNATTGITWTYGHSRNEDTFAINGKGIMLRRASDSYLQATFASGVGSFSFQYRKAYTGTTARQLELLVNGVQVATTTEFGTTEPDPTAYNFTFDVNTSGPVTLRIKNVGSTTTNRQAVIDNISWTAYSSGGTPTVATPTFSPTSGTYYSAQNVTISSETDGATIRYTTNGDEPDETSAVFSSPISVSTTTTIKAKAYKTEMDPSATATANYVLPTEVSTLAAMRSAGPGVYRVTGEVLLTLKTTTRNAKYVQDATGAVLIDDNNGIITTSYNIGDGITGLMGTTAVFNGMLQFTPAADPGVATSTGNTVTPTEIALSEIGSYEARLVKVSGVVINGEGNFVVSQNYNLNGESNPNIRTQYSDLDYIGTAIPSVPQDIVGVVLKFNTINQFVPRSLAEMTNTVYTSPTILVTESSVNSMSAQIETTDAATVTVNASSLTANITLAVTGDNADLFTLSTYSIPHTDGTVSNVVVTITYAPLVAGSHSALLTLSSTGAEDVTRALTGTATDPPAPITIPNVIISEVYGGGGNSGATLKQDFIELYNTTDESIEIGGWSIQYYSNTGTGAATVSNVFVIPSGKFIPAQKHFLIQAAAGTGGSVDLENPDAISSIAIAATNGKVILYTTADAQTINASEIASITGNPNFKDYVPFGSAIPVWGTALGALSNTTSAKRKKVDNAYVYTQVVGADFEIGAPEPQNSGLISSTHSPSLTSIFAHNAQIRFTATAGESVEVYNAVGQKLISTLATDGQNVLNISEKGVMIVKVGGRIAKVIL